MHKHEWTENYVTFDYKYDCLQLKCSECDEIMMPEDVVKRLNATECLIDIDEHFDLEDLAWGLRSNYGPKDPGYKLANALIEYAETMEGDHETNKEPVN